MICRPVVGYHIKLALNGAVEAAKSPGSPRASATVLCGQPVQLQLQTPCAVVLAREPRKKKKKKTRRRGCGGGCLLSILSRTADAGCGRRLPRFLLCLSPPPPLLSPLQISLLLFVFFLPPWPLGLATSTTSPMPLHSYDPSSSPPSLVS